MSMNSKSKQSAPLPKFSAPPINEVVAGVFHSAIDGFRLPHFGLFWDRVKNQFPRCEHAPPLAPPGVPEGLPWPRVWLLGDDQTTLLQLQRDCFLFNWRRVVGDESYPHYSEVIDSFRRYRDEFACFLRDQELAPPGIHHCELSYINHIPAGEIWQNPSEIGNFMPDLKWREMERFLPDPESAAWKGVFALPEDYGSLTVSLSHRTRNTDGAPLYVLDLSAKGLGGDRGETRIAEWFETAHEWIVRGFCDLTDERIQVECWGRAEL